jgi:GT2 family glycosyltransferase
MRSGIVVPNLNQSRFLPFAIDSLLAVREVPVSIAVVDGGSTDESVRIAEGYRSRLSYYRTRQDEGQAAAVNEGVAALLVMDPDIRYVGFLNADDVLLDNGLVAMVRALEERPELVAVAGRAQIITDSGAVTGEYPSAPFSRSSFARRCTICQPATLIRRTAWEAVGGLDASLKMCLDYDLWWRLFSVGPIGSIDAIVAASRDHPATKTRTHRELYFREAMRIVRRECGRVPWHWYISEALEREAGWDTSIRPAFRARLRAGARAFSSYIAAQWPGGSPP